MKVVTGVRIRAPFCRLGPAAGLVLLVALVVQTPRAQMRVAPLDDDRGHVALGLALSVVLWFAGGVAWVTVRP